MNYYDFLDKKGGFYLYRWGDALVRTVALHMLADPQKVHFFPDIGYEHQVSLDPFDFGFLIITERMP